MRTFAASWRVCSGLLILGLAGAAGLSAQEGGKDETFENPVYKHWSAFKVGATVTRREKVKFAADSYEGQLHPEHTLVKDTTIKLIEVTPKKVVVELIESEHGRGFVRENAPIKLTYFAHIKKGLGTPKESFAKHKQEDVEVKIKTKTYKATLVDTTHKQGDMVRTQQIWLTDEVPGGILKDIKTQKKGDQLVSESTLEIVSYNVP
jgi:hypothetical protein